MVAGWRRRTRRFSAALSYSENPNPSPNPTTKQHAVCEHSTKYSHMSGRIQIKSWETCCRNVCATLSCNCHAAGRNVADSTACMRPRCIHVFAANGRGEIGASGYLCCCSWRLRLPHWKKSRHRATFYSNCPPPPKAAIHLLRQKAEQKCIFQRFQFEGVNGVVGASRSIR